jgi:hypothetical protein
MTLKNSLLGLLQVALFLAIAAIPSAHAAKLKTSVAREPASKTCAQASDCGSELKFSESCRMIGSDNSVCDGRQDVELQCWNGSCARVLGSCGDCKWSKAPVAPDTCQSDPDCSVGMPTTDKCSVVTPDNRKCEGTMAVHYQCNPRANGQKKCDRVIGLCGGC